MSVAISVLVSTFHSLIAQSYDPLARIVPSVLNATEFTVLLCPLSVAISVLVFTFHSLIAQSYDPLARIVPSVLNATEVTLSLCPSTVPCFSFYVS